MSGSDADLIAFRCACGKKLKLPGSAAGRLAKCPKCGGAMRVPSHADASPAVETTPGRPTPANAGAATGADPFEFAPLPPEHAPADAASAELTQTCPSCSRGWPGTAKVCTDCGVYLATGQAIMLKQEDNLDEKYMAAQSTIWWLSWATPFFGFFPIASEAFGLHRPRVIQAFALVTVIASLVFFGFLLSDPDLGGEMGRFMLWGGDRGKLPVNFAELAAEMKDDGMSEREVEAELAQLRVELETRMPERQPYQFLTHQFLHLDFWHLLGNMIFLLVFGSRINALLGQWPTLILYPALGVVAALAHMASISGQMWTPMLGASGAIFGLAGMYIVFFPLNRVHLALWSRMYPLRPIFLTLGFVTIRGFWFLLWFIAWDVLFILLGAETGVGHWAHVGGFAAGVVVATLLLVTRLVNGHGTDMFSAILGRRAWWLVGRPRAL